MWWRGETDQHQLTAVGEEVSIAICRVRVRKYADLKRAERCRLSAKYALGDFDEAAWLDLSADFDGASWSPAEIGTRRRPPNPVGRRGVTKVPARLANAIRRLSP